MYVFINLVVSERHPYLSDIQGVQEFSPRIFIILPPLPRKFRNWPNKPANISDCTLALR